MKLVFVSDIHGSAYYARMLPEIDQREKPERIVLLGDYPTRSIYTGKDTIVTDAPMSMTNYFRPYKVLPQK